jgi:hypothetical protein
MDDGSLMRLNKFLTKNSFDNNAIYAYLGRFCEAPRRSAGLFCLLIDDEKGAARNDRAQFRKNGWIGAGGGTGPRYRRNPHGGVHEPRGLGDHAADRQSHLLQPHPQHPLASGNVQLVKEIRIDCDDDTVVLKVEQVGGAACHTGHRSCFYKRVKEDQTLEIVGQPVFDPKEVYKK